MAAYEHLLKPRVNTVAHDAGFFRRALAFILDIFLIDLIVTAPLTSLFTPLLNRVEKQGFLDLTYTQAELGAIIMAFLLVYAYFVLFEYVLGQTVGQMVLGITVQSTRLWQYFVRNLFLLPFFPFILFWVIEPCAIIASRRGLLERISQTRTLYQQSIVM